jgi:hypothetical protein
MPLSNERKRRNLFVRQGWSGTPSYMGFINRGNEIDADFPRIAGDMVRTVAPIRQAVNLKNQALLSVDWWFETPEGRENDPEAVALKDFAQFVWDGLDRDWQSILANNLCSYMDVGFAYSEIVFRPPTEEFPYVTIANLAPCEQEAHYRWLTTPDGRTLLGIEQQANTLSASSGTGNVIPASKAFLLVFDQQGADFNGRGLLRSCYEDYEEWCHARDQRKVAAQRWAQPVVLIKADKGAADAIGTTPAQFEQNVANAQASADAMIAGDQTWLTESEGVTFSKWNTETFDPAALNTVIQACEENVARLYLAQWLLFAGNGGSLAMAEALIAEFNKSLRNHCLYIAGQVRDQLIARLVQINFGEVAKAKLPVLRFRLSHEPDPRLPPEGQSEETV